MQNPDIARLFDEVADLLEIQDANPFRVRAYRNAARTIRDYPEPLTDLVRAGTKDLTDIAGIGDDLAEKITDIVTTGELPLRKQLASKLPAGLLDLLRIPGLGPAQGEIGGRPRHGARQGPGPEAQGVRAEDGRKNARRDRPGAGRGATHAPQ